jgi:tetratricopeptide (TPR) repeat protein
MVLARLARGFLSVQLLPAYRDEAVTAFGAALDELAQLPFATSHVKILGAPLLDAMKRRPADAEQRVLAEERNWRRTLQGFNEGLLSLHFGESQSAVEKLIAAMNYVSHPDTTSAPSSLPRAADMLRNDDSSDLLLHYQGLLRSVSVLALIEHRQYDLAVVEAVRTLCPDKLPPGDEEIIRHIKPDLLQQAVAAIDSPFTGFALARALEEWVASHGPVSFPERDTYMQYARRALATCQRVFTSGMQSRYPQLFVLVQDTDQRLNNPEYFSDLANQFRSQNRLDDAFRILQDGVSRHLSAATLWEQLMQVAIDRADVARADKQAKYREALQIAQQLPGEFVAPFMGAFWHGYIAEHLEDYESARRAYSLAQSLARSEEERVRASARLALINLTLSPRNP